jgi:hypothetical protein
MLAYGIISLTEEDTKTSSVCDVISNFPGLPSFKFSTVPPTYEMSPSSTASKGQAKSKTRQSVASLFMTVPSPNQSKLRLHDRKAFLRLHLDCRCLSEEALCFASRFECALKRKCRGDQTPTHLPSTTGANSFTAQDRIFRLDCLSRRQVLIAAAIVDNRRCGVPGR